eukprot:TRINITY_DN46072_c0_g1_i1.p1 TRINITY_DN46072_c0_g1~~TRINITY_DN46072_c0_g1_i1.p1  ORF type:complete len:508 (-),score=56.86 TRINITY_DN46072_c0_g1_i1:20-1507(-)
MEGSGLVLKVLPPPTVAGPYQFHFFDVERQLLTYVTALRRAGHGKRLVVYADAFDTAWLACSQSLEHALELTGNRVFLGCEGNLFPAGRPGYPKPLRSYRSVAAANRIFECTGQRVLGGEPCLAAGRLIRTRGNRTSPLPVYGGCLYGNAGVYGGRAENLEVVLRELLKRQRLLSNVHKHSGLMHQYLWNQYMLDYPEQVSLDYRGDFVVNLFPLALSPEDFVFDAGASRLRPRSRLFGRDVCIAHANGGTAWSTLELLYAVTTQGRHRWATASTPLELIDEVPTVIDSDGRSAGRLLVDSSLCFGRPGRTAQAGAWRGRLEWLRFAAQALPVVRSLQVVVLRPHGNVGSRTASLASLFLSKLDGAASVDVSRLSSAIVSASFDVVSVQRTLIPRLPHNSLQGRARGRIALESFGLEIREGDCVGLRGRGDFLFAALEDAASFGGLFRGGLAGDRGRPVGAWVANRTGDLAPGDRVDFSSWLPRAYLLSAQAVAL